MIGRRAVLCVRPALPVLRVLSVGLLLAEAAMVWADILMPVGGLTPTGGAVT